MVLVIVIQPLINLDNVAFQKTHLSSCGAQYLYSDFMVSIDIKILVSRYGINIRAYTNGNGERRSGISRTLHHQNAPIWYI